MKKLVVKRLVPLIALIAACAPDIAQEIPSGASPIVALFDPDPDAPVLPLPNDLAKDPTTGQITITTKDSAPAAQKEFNEQYLNSLDGFPFESTASVAFSAALDPKTVTSKTVLAFDVTAGQPPRPVTVSPSVTDTTVRIAPPEGGWTRGHTYAIALVGGEKGVRGAANSEEVIGSAAWALIQSTAPLVECPDDDFKSPDCHPTVDVIPSKKSDPKEKIGDQTQKAIKLEGLRKRYEPLFKLFASPPTSLDRNDIPAMWTFSIVNAGEVTFDLTAAKPIIPFPHDALRQGPNGTVSLPNPNTGKPLTPADCASAADPLVQLICGLNTLDGFSTLAAPVSENSLNAGALSQGLIDARTLSRQSAGLVVVKTEAPAPIRTTPNFTPCLNCTSSRAVTQTSQPSAPQQLQWKLEAPLDEKTTYFAYVTADVTDTLGKPVVATPSFALLRSKAPLVENGKSTVSVLTDEQANKLETLRAAMMPAFDGLEKAGIPRSKLALAFPFTTQSESTLLDKIHAIPAAAKAAGLPDIPLSVDNITTALKANSNIPSANITAFYTGSFLTPVAVTGPGGTINPDPTKFKLQPVNFVMAVPNASAPAAGFPVTIFGHGLTRNRNDALAIANAIAAKNQIVIATDVLFHGDRSSCTGSTGFLKALDPTVTSDDNACADPSTMKCDGGALQGLCVLRTGARTDCSNPDRTKDPTGDATCAAAGQGRCAADGKCQGANAGFKLKANQTVPAISGWNIFSLTNFFATRDNFRQQVIDLAQLVAVIKSTAPGNLFSRADNRKVDTAKINYVGQSLGGILGTLFNSVSPDTQNIALNVPGGNLVSIILEAKSFESQKQALLGGLKLLGREPGSPAFDEFLGIIQWILDPADPSNMAYRLTRSVTPEGGRAAPPTGRNVFIQFIEGDETVPNVSSLALVRGANRDFKETQPNFNCKAPLFCFEFTNPGFAEIDRHEFLLTQTPKTSEAQSQVTNFLSRGAL